MLKKTEIALLQLATNEINKRESVKVPNEKKKSGLFLYNSLVKYGLTQLFRENQKMFLCGACLSQVIKLNYQFH